VRATFFTHLTKNMNGNTHMTLFKSSGILACAIAAAMASAGSVAHDDAGWYVGANLGQARARLNEFEIVNNLLAPGYSALRYDENSIDGGGKVFAGYALSSYWAIEAGYFDLGEFQFNSLTAPAGMLTTNMQVRGFNLDLVATLPLTQNLSGLARLGVTRALTQATFTGTGAASVLGGKLHDRDSLPKAGVGLQYKFSDVFAMRLEAERHVISNALYSHDNIDLYSVGVVYRFGAKPAPVPVVIAPPPAPVIIVMPAPVAIAPPAPRFEKYTLSATELFGFDSETLHLPQPKLDEIAAALKTEGGPNQIVIVGYTDRLGSPDYNQQLSERRANAVKNYIASKGVAADRLQVAGKGEAEPVVQCTETHKAALIECLKPNRRVEIDQVVVERKVSP
jgi:OmpA-OmpF porin, OOP family